MSDSFNKFEKLIHDIIFIDKCKIKINILDYVEDLIYYEDFIEKVSNILKNSNIDIYNENIDLKDNDVIWTFIAKK